MNYKPFSALATGAICRDLDHATLLLIKTDLKNRAMVLESVWIDNKLYPRGTLVELAENECVIAVEEGADLVLPLTRKDPVDPRRRFWAAGDTKSVCPNHPTRINVFAGLFLYSGFGMGSYYSSVDNEVIWCDYTRAEALAAAEGILVVHFDSFSWTKDPDLAYEKEQARKVRDEKITRERQRELCAN